MHMRRMNTVCWDHRTCTDKAPGWRHLLAGTCQLHCKFTWDTRHPRTRAASTPNVPTHQLVSPDDKALQSGQISQLLSPTWERKEPRAQVRHRLRSRGCSTAGMKPTHADAANLWQKLEPVVSAPDLDQRDHDAHLRRQRRQLIAAQVQVLDARQRLVADNPQVLLAAAHIAGVVSAHALCGAREAAGAPARGAHGGRTRYRSSVPSSRGPFSPSRCWTWHPSCRRTGPAALGGVRGGRELDAAHSRDVWPGAESERRSPRSAAPAGAAAPPAASRGREGPEHVPCPHTPTPRRGPAHCVARPGRQCGR